MNERELSSAERWQLIREGLNKAIKNFGEAARPTFRAIARFSAVADDILWPLYYHDDLCGMHDGTEWDVFI